MSKRLIWNSEKHKLRVYKQDGRFVLWHHNEIICEADAKEEKEMKIFKKMYNRIVKNHNELKINYEKN